MILLAKLANSLRINEGIKVCYFTKDLNAKIKVLVQKSLPHSHAEGSVVYSFSSIYKDYPITTVCKVFMFNISNLSLQHSKSHRCSS